MSEKPISDLRRRMLEDMAVRKFGDKTRHDYIRHVEAFARFLGRSPDMASAEDVRRYQVHLTESGVQPPTLNSSASALRFFFGTTLDRAGLARHLARVHYPRKLPRVLSPEEVGRLLEAAPGPGLKYKAALSIAYGAGLRVGEVVMLRIGDIDSKRMLIRVEQGTFKDYRVEGPSRYTTMTLATGEFIRRFLLHVLPKGFHRIRHYGLLAGGSREENLAKARKLLAARVPQEMSEEPVTPAAASDALANPCPCCAGRMIVIETFAAGCQPQHRPTTFGIDTS
jgi:site-specific recombinase XerD